MKKSLTKNAVMNVLRTAFGMLFPLITYPYISRVLQVENLGKINFSSSIVNYFALFAAFGITTYAVREGSRIRENQVRFQAFANEMFTINFYTTLTAYIMLGIILVLSGSLRNYAWIVALQSLNIFFTTLGTDWINTVYEDFFYITVRTLAFQVISLVLMFVFVHDSSHLFRYVMISLFSSAGANVCNFAYCRKYARIRIIKGVRWRAHLKPMALFFCSNITTTIFVNSDQTMLGLICGDYYVGLYAIAVKIYTIAKNIFTSVLIVMVPRISYMEGNSSGRDKEELAGALLNVLVILALPLAFGLFLISDGAVALVGGERYMGASASLRILAVAILCSAAASYMTYIVVIPQGKEKILLTASTVSAAVNLGLNFFTIRMFYQDGAAFTTAISEFIVFIVEFIVVRPKINFRKTAVNFLQSAAACLFMILLNIVARYCITDIRMSAILTAALSVPGYFLLLFVQKNEALRLLLEHTVLKKQR